MKRLRIVLVALALSLTAPFIGSATAQAHSGYQPPARRHHLRRTGRLLLGRCR